MTRDRDIERVLDRFYADGPSEMPDRVLLGVIDRIERVPQRRLVRLETRFAAMSLNARLAAAAAVVIVIAGVGAIALTSRQPYGTAPTPSPSIVPTTPVPTAGAAVPDALQHRWNGPTRAVPGLEPAPDFAGVVLTAATLQFDAGSAGTDAFASGATAISGDEVRFDLRVATARCEVGTVGTYRYTLSPGGGHLTLTPMADACAARSAAISGDWERSACPNRGMICLWDLEAGTYASGTFQPFLPAAQWKYSYGRLSYTVPAGWRNEEEDRMLYVLSKQDVGEDEAIWLLSDEAAHVQSTACPPNAVDTKVGRTPAALATWLGSLPGLATTAPQPVTIGGLTGLTLDVSVDPAWKRTCPSSGGLPAVELFADVNVGVEHDVAVQGTTPIRFLLLDLGDGRSLIVLVSAKDKATYDAFLPEAMSVIDTFEFHR
jgi:hypothetical protein